MSVGEKTASVTPRIDPAKAKHRGVFLALRADAKEFPGGISAYAAQTGRNPHIVADQINPDNDKSPPSFSGLLDLIQTTGAHRTLNALAYLGHRATIPLPESSRPTADAMQHFLELSARASAATGFAASALADNNLNAQERDQLGLELDAPIAAAADFRASLRG